MDVTTTRHKVLSYLNKMHTASAREISRSLKMSSANVRHHLRVLVSDGRLEVNSARQREGRGRPEKVYSVPRAALGDNLSGLSDALLTKAEGVDMAALARRLVGESNFASQPIAKQLHVVIEKLNEMNYHARWEAGPEGPRVSFGHCPYARILAKHPELCEMDVNMLSQFFARPVSSEPKIDPQRVWLCPFIFSVG